MKDPGEFHIQLFHAIMLISSQIWNVHMTCLSDRWTFHDNKCFRVFGSLKDWEKAQDNCIGKGNGGTLARARSRETVDFLIELLNNETDV